MVVVSVRGDLRRCRGSLRCSSPGTVWSGRPGWPPRGAPPGSGWTQLRTHTENKWTQRHAQQTHKDSHRERNSSSESVEHLVRWHLHPGYYTSSLRRLDYTNERAQDVQREMKRWGSSEDITSIYEAGLEEFIQFLTLVIRLSEGLYDLEFGISAVCRRTRGRSRGGPEVTPW